VVWVCCGVLVFFRVLVFGVWWVVFGFCLCGFVCGVVVVCLVGFVCFCGGFRCGECWGCVFFVCEVWGVFLGVFFVLGVFLWWFGGWEWEFLGEFWE